MAEWRKAIRRSRRRGRTEELISRSCLTVERPAPPVDRRACGVVARVTVDVAGNRDRRVPEHVRDRLDVHAWPQARPRRLYSVPVAVSVSEAPGTAHSLADLVVFLGVDNLGLQIQSSETSNATDFSQNLTRASCEGRFGTSALSPLGVVSCDLTA
jgi:hypothetical protein